MRVHPQVPTSKACYSSTRRIEHVCLVFKIHKSRVPDLSGEYIRLFTRSKFEILLCYMRREHAPADAGASWQIRMTQAWDSVWSRLFTTATTNRRRSLMLQHYTVSVLSGLASTLMLEGEGAALVESELELLTRTLQEELAMEPAARPS